MMNVSRRYIKGYRTDRAESKVVCIHSSLKSFGFVKGGAQTIVNAFRQGYTILVPTFLMTTQYPRRKMTDL